MYFAAFLWNFRICSFIIIIYHVDGGRDRMDLSVIVPMFNSENTIKKCIESLLKIENLNYEIIIVDNNSKDNSVAICKSLKQSNDCIKITNARTQVVSAARNRGIKEATGKYIMFVDSDDQVIHENILSCYQLIDNRNYDLLVCAVKKSYSNSQFFVSVGEDSSDIDDIIINITENYSINEVWGKFFKKEIIDKYQLNFNESFSLGEDEDFVCRYLLYCNDILALTIPIYHYYVIENTNTLTQKFYLDYFAFVEIPNRSLVAVYEKFNLVNSYNYLLVERQLNDLWKGFKLLFSKNCNLCISEKINYINVAINSSYYKNILKNNRYNFGFFKYYLMKQKNAKVIYFILSIYMNIKHLI